MRNLSPLQMRAQGKTILRLDECFSDVRTSSSPRIAPVPVTVAVVTTPRTLSLAFLDRPPLSRMPNQEVRGGRSFPHLTVPHTDRLMIVVPEQATPTPSSFAPSAHVQGEKGPTARVLFDFALTSPFELSVTGALRGINTGVFADACVH